MAEIKVSLSDFVKWTPRQEVAWLSMLENKFTLFGGARFGGKALSLDTPIPTPDGYVPIVDLKEGDKVFGSDGNICNVLWRSDIETYKSYDVYFSDGSVLRASDSHQWVTETYLERRKNARRTDEYREKRREKRPSRSKGKRPDVIIKNIAKEWEYLVPLEPGVHTTEQIKNSLHHKGETNHSVKVCGAIQTPFVPLQIDPYVLGAWLGDGTSTAGSITGIDDEVFEQCHKVGYEISQTDKTVKTLFGLKVQLRKMGLLGNKHIPMEYLRSAPEQRLALLQGLMDTDGTVDKHSGKCSFISTSKALADGMLDLLNGLGIKAVITETRAKLYDKDCGAEYNLNFVSELPVFRLTRKAVLQNRSIGGRSKRRFIVDVREVEPEAMCCISVDSPDHTYLAGETFIPTHNSYWLRNALISWLILQGMRGNKHVQVGLFCKTYSELEDRHIPKFTQMPEWLGTFSDSQVYGLSFRLSERYGGGIIMLRNLDKGADRYKSAEFAAIGVDELTEFDADQFLILIGSLRWVGIDHHPFIAGSNPDGIGNDWVKACFIDKDYSNQQLAGLKNMADQFNFVRSLATDNPYLPKEYYQILDAQPPARRRAWRDGDWNVIQGAAFPEFSTDTHVMPLNKIPDLNFESYIPYTFPRYQGIDWGIARPFVCLFGAINPANGRLIVYDEISQAGLTDSQQAEAIKMRSDENEMKARRFADPKMWNKQSVNDKLMSTADVYQAHGVKIYPGDPNRHAKKSRVHELLAIRPDGYPGLIITPECKQLIKQLQKLMTAKDDPEDVNDHQEDDSYDAFGMLTNPVGKYNKPYKRAKLNANNKSPFQALERI